MVYSGKVILKVTLKNMELATPVVMISGQAHIEMAVRATRLGAVDFPEKPLSTEKLLLTVENVLRLKRLKEENEELLGRLGKHEIVWSGLERLLLLATGDSVDFSTVLAALPRATAATPSGGDLPVVGTLAQRVDAFERETIVAELRRHQNHIAQTARSLGPERSYLYKKCQQLGIDLRAMRKEE
jgi:DNA-binding NtrC family response regulator